MANRHFGLIGKKLGHSFSKNYFTQKFLQLGLSDTYELFELAQIGEVTGLWEQDPLLRGFNVTIPYKEAIIPFLDALSPDAANVGAVNTVRLCEDGCFGYNTDVIGFRQSLREFLGGAKPASALILGTGGASKAVQFVLDQIDLPYVLASRSAGRDRVAYEALTAVEVRDIELIINTTPAGMYPEPDAMPPLPLAGLREGQWVYDLIYNPETTLLMQEAARRGAHTCNGLRMLHLQAEAAWEIWNQEG